MRKPDCLNCPNSFSLPANELFDDGTVANDDRLVCMLTHRLVDESDCCDKHPDRRCGE